MGYPWGLVDHRSYQVRADRRPDHPFDHHSEDYAARAPEIYADMREKCPIAWTAANGGHWVVTSYDAVAEIARDDIRFSSAHEPEGPKQGVVIPTSPALPGMLETDPPLLAKLRRAAHPWLAPAAVERLRPTLERYATWCVDQFIEGGRGDVVLDLAGPVPSMITMTLLGLPLSDWAFYADAVHRAVYTPPDDPDRPAAERALVEGVERIMVVSAQRRAHPGSDFISMFASLEIDGEPLPLEVVGGNVFNIIGGGVDTTTGLIANSLMHLADHDDERQRLRKDPSLLPLACEEYLRVFAPIPGLARTVTQPCEIQGQPFGQWDRVWMSWASANLDPERFDDPDEIRLDRFPNRHASFGLGAHRCIGSNVARAVWLVCVGEVLRRIPDYVVELDAAQRYPSIGTINGWINMPISFTPGSVEGASLELVDA